MNLPEARMNDMLKQADDIATMIRITQDQYRLMLQMNDVTHQMVLHTHDLQTSVEKLQGSYCRLR